MSQETSQWLNQNVLIGMTGQRGTAWHYRASDQGSEPNHYVGPIPFDDVTRRLFSWYAVSRRVAVEKPSDLDNATHIGPDGTPMRWTVQEDRQAIDTSDTADTLGHFKSGYEPHQYTEWLLDNVAGLLDDDLVISSAGLLRKRAVAWVEVSVPETRNVCGVDYRPNLVACTSFDGTLATTYKRTIGATVCDNTLSAALGETGRTIRIKHSKHSGYRVAEVRNALAIVDSISAQFEDIVQHLVASPVGHLQFREVLDVLVPVGPDASKTAKTTANGKRNALTSLYYSDERVAPWTGTAFGVLQMANTWEQHERPTRGSTQRAERNMLDALNGSTDASDAEVLAALRGLQLI